MEWAKEMLDDLDDGVSLVIAEGRESGNVGLFGSTGDVHGDLVESIVDIVPVDKVSSKHPRRTSRPGSSSGSEPTSTSATSRPTK